MLEGVNDGRVAGEGLALVEQFLNTLDQRTFSRHGRNHVAVDELTSAESLASWLQARALAGPGARLGPADLAAAVTLRDALRAALSGERPMQLADFALHLVPDEKGGLRLAAASGVDGLDVVLETVAASVAGGGWGRLKLCAAPDCRWAFYDTSRSGGGRWCQMQVCGNRTKTRAYRRRTETS